MAGEVLTCVDYRPATETAPGECLAEAWMPAPSFLPVLPTADAVLLGSAVAFCWAYAWAWKRVIRTVQART